MRWGQEAALADEGDNAVTRPRLGIVFRNGGKVDPLDSLLGSGLCGEFHKYHSFRSLHGSQSDRMGPI